MIYQIRDWNDLYETHQTRRLKRLQWVPVPNRMDGDGYAELVEGPAGAANLGCWLAILEIASRCEPRGTLARDLRGIDAHDARSLARIARLPVQTMEAAIDRLLHIGWLTAVESSITRNLHGTCTDDTRDTRAIDAPPARDLHGIDALPARRMEGNGMEWNGKEPALPEITVLVETPVENPAPQLPPPETQSRKNGKQQTPESTVQWLRENLHGYVKACSGPCRSWDEPDEAICRQVLAECRGRSLDDIGWWLKALHKSGEAPERNYAWFVAMAQKRFGESKPATSGLTKAAAVPCELP
jgi:hypothetical protein